MRRYSPLLLILTFAACNQQTATHPDQPRSAAPPGGLNDKEVARAFLSKMDKNKGYRLGLPLSDIIKNGGATEPLEVIQRGCVELLQEGTTEERARAAQMLGRLGDQSAIGPLVKALKDPDKELRETICYALGWLKATGEPAEAALVNLRKNDPVLAVRLAAALTLNRPTDAEAVTVFELGLQLGPAKYVRQRCEDELEKIGKLRLPLPEDVYMEISYDRYEAIQADPWYHVQREIRKGDYLYFEAVERPRHVLYTIPHWYRTKFLAKGERPSGNK